jgi:hypothetical protein
MTDLLRMKILPWIVMMLLITACATSPAGGPAGDVPDRFPRLLVSDIDADGAHTGLVRRIIGAPEEMMDAHVLGAGDFGKKEARNLRKAILKTAKEYGFGEDTAKAVTLRLRIITHLARIGEIWPSAEYLVEAEFFLHGPGLDSGVKREVHMYYNARFYWTIESVRSEMTRCLGSKIVSDIACVLKEGECVSLEKSGRAIFFKNRGEAREEFLDN